ncbi:MAG TPA: hypothetical protein VE621_01110, partial [Bryobacteraceae bacterium]|nr:hypothetical protein [Bryobacteraceae bacterium]
LWKRQWAAGWFVLWFLVVLGPLLPLRDHVSEYYLTIPTIGLAMLGGWGLAEATRAGWGWRLLAVLVFVTYTWSNAAMARVATRYNFERGRLAKAIVLGVERVLELHPGKIVLLHGIDKDAFYAGVADYPFRLFRATDIYLTPESQKNIGLDLETYWGLALPQPALVKALRQERGVVYQLEGDQLRNVTRLYTAQLAPASSTLSSFVRLGQPLFSDQLGPEWYPIDQGFRWMPGKATVRLAPLGSVLVARGWVPEQVVQSHPEFTIRVGESTLVRQTLTSSGGFEVTAKIPDNFRSLPELLIQLECSKTWVPDGDGRQLCAAFDHIAIR